LSVLLICYSDATNILAMLRPSLCTLETAMHENRLNSMAYVAQDAGRIRELKILRAGPDQGGQVSAVPPRPDALAQKIKI